MFYPPSQARQLALFAARLPAAPRGAAAAILRGTAHTGQSNVKQSFHAASAPLLQIQPCAREESESRHFAGIWAMRAKAAASAIVILLFLSPRIVPDAQVMP